MSRLALAVVILGLAACAAPPELPTSSLSVSPSPASSSERPNLGISNGTTLAVTVLVNGQRIGTFLSGAEIPSIDLSGLPGLPWDIEARTASGRKLATMLVGAADVQGQSGSFVRIDLSCGRLTIWVGSLAPEGPAPAASPGTPGDCQL